MIVFNRLPVVPAMTTGATEAGVSVRSTPESERVVSSRTGVAEIAIRGNRITPSSMERVQGVVAPSLEARMTIRTVPLIVLVGVMVTLEGNRLKAKHELCQQGRRDQADDTTKPQIREKHSAW